MANISKDFTFSSGDTIIASEHNQNFSEIYIDYSGNIDNNNIAANAAIDNSKLNLTTINKPITITDDVTLGGGASDSVTINANDGITYTPAATWTFTGAQTVSGTWADLGSVTTVDVNGGTLDGVQVGGTTATGELLVNDSSDGANGLGSQGTSGQFLQSAGAGSNPTWASGGSVLLTNTPVTTALNTGDIMIAASKQYLVTVEVSNDTADAIGKVLLRFNSIGGASDYAWNKQESTMTTSPTASATGDNEDDGIVLSDGMVGATTGFMRAKFYIDTNKIGTTYSAFVHGTSLDNGVGGVLTKNDFYGVMTDNETIISFEIVWAVGAGSPTVTGSVKVYELG